MFSLNKFKFYRETYPAFMRDFGDLKVSKGKENMAKFKNALALVLSLAMVLTLAPIANVQTKAAAEYKIKAANPAPQPRPR